MAKKTYPFLNDYLDNGEDVIHPLLTALQKGGKIDSLTIDSEWTDDHCPCVGVTIIIDGKEYDYNDSWLSREGLKLYYQAEVNHPPALESLREHLLTHVEDY